MATTENLPSPSTERPIGFGRLKRKEDGDKERAIVKELSREIQAEQPGAKRDLGPAYRGDAMPAAPEAPPKTPDKTPPPMDL